MRAFKIIIGGDLINPITFGVDNPTGLNCKFNIAFFNDATSTSIPNTIEIFNLDKKYYKNAKQYINKPIAIYAGFDQSVLAIKAGYEKISSNLLFFGVITNIIPNYSDYTTPSVVFSIQGSYSSDEKISKKSVNFKGKVLQLNQMSIPSVSIVKWVQSFVPTGWVVAPSPTMASFTLLSQSTITLSANNLQQALNQLQKLGICVSSKSNIITLSYSILSAKNGAASSFSSLSSLFSSISTGLPKQISLVDMIGQPQIINLVELQITTRLRADINLNDTIKIPGGFLSALSSSDFSIVNSLTGDNLSVFTGGLFTVTAINHIGDSRNSSPQAWITSLRLVAKVI